MLTLALDTSPNQLDPALVVDVAGGQVCSMIFEGLVRFAPDGDVVPAVARTWTVEGRRYVFHLNSESRFSDGRPVTARDVIRSFERVLSPDSRSSRGWVLDRIRGSSDFAAGTADRIDGLTAVDDSTVTIELDEPFRPFLQMLAMPAAAVVADSPGAPAGDLVGSGPWVLEQWQRGDYLRLIPNPHHAGVAPSVEAVRYRILPEAFTKIAEFESGAIDILEIPQAEVARFLSDERHRKRIQKRPELRVLYIGLNNRKGPLEDVRVRRALNMAVDVDQIIDVLTGGHAVRATGSIPPSLAGYRSRPPYPYDPAGARRALREAGYENGFTMDIWQRDSPEGNRIVEAIQGYLSQVGVEVNIVKREWSAFKEAVSQGKVDAFFLDWWADYPDAENFLYPLFHSDNTGAGGNRAFFRNDQVDAVIESAQTIDDTETGAALYARADSLIYDAAPWIYLYFPTRFVVVSADVEGYTFPVLYLGHDFAGVRKLGARGR